MPNVPVADGLMQQPSEAVSEEYSRCGVYSRYHDSWGSSRRLRPCLPIHDNVELSVSSTRTRERLSEEHHGGKRTARIKQKGASTDGI